MAVIESPLFHSFSWKKTRKSGLGIAVIPFSISKNFSTPWSNKDTLEPHKNRTKPTLLED